MGAIGFPRRRFAAFDAIAATTWALYAAMIGYLGGASFAHNTLKGLAFGLGLATAVTLSLEIVRRVRRSRMTAVTSRATATRWVRPQTEHAIRVREELAPLGARSVIAD
jgi:hypothetical protein